MNPIKANIKIEKKGHQSIKIDNAIKQRFSPFRCITYNGGLEEKKIINLLGEYLISKYSDMAIYGKGKFFDYFLEHFPPAKSHFKYVIEDDSSIIGSKISDIPIITVNQLPREIKTVFLCETLTVPRMRMQNKLPSYVEVVSPEIIKEIDWEAIPEQAWIPEYNSIYPFHIPEIEFLPDQDLILIDCPSRDMSLMPNGVGYVHNILNRTHITFQTFDLNIVVYHRFHIHRLFDGPEKITTPEGKELPDDPWLAENEGIWQYPDTIEYFRPELNEIVNALVKVRPKILALSIHARNIKFSREVVLEVRKLLPDTIILVGGYSCYQSEIGLKAFPECDYMIIREAELTLPPLIEKLVAGERPIGLPGILSRYDLPETQFVAGPLPQDLDAIEMPKYDWVNLKIYRNYNHYQLVPIISSRGCRWSRCRFCAERIYWRVRSPGNVVDEFEWLVDHGCDLFMFNESDLNGKPEVLLAICDEIIRRNLKVRLTGQLRIHKKNDRAFFDKLKAAGFSALRFGVDAWSENGLKMQCKGYLPGMISQNLKDCWEAGIFNEVNTVIGVPGETEEDIEETIALMSENKPYIGRIANINPLMLTIGSIYWEDPEKYNIHFREEKKKIFEDYPNSISSHLWYSIEPYIDEKIRNQRMEKILLGLYNHGFELGPYAKHIIKKMGEGMDVMRGNDTRVKKNIKLEKLIKKDGVNGMSLEEQQKNKVSHKIIKLDRGFYLIKDVWVDGQQITDYITHYLSSDDTDVKIINDIELEPVGTGFHGYNLLRIKDGGDVYAIKQGFPFDAEKVHYGGYEPGVFFQGNNIREVQNCVIDYISKTDSLHLMYRDFNVLAKRVIKRKL